MAFVVGPRQVGKTTLAREILKERSCADLYRNWDDLEWRRSLAREPYGFADRFRPTKGRQKPLVVLDEIHKFPRWKSYLKGFWDTRKDRLNFLVTGSGRLDVYQKGGDSLLGRYHQYRLHPLSLREIVDPSPPPADYRHQKTMGHFLTIGGKPPSKTVAVFRRLLKWGGFPQPYLRQNLNEWRLWQRERRQLILREDLRDLSRIQLVSHVEELVELLVQRAGGLLSFNSLREDLQVALDSVRLWMAYLKRLYFIYTIRPYSKSIARALRKEPKCYLWDWSELTDEGRRFENMVAGHLLKWCHFTQDWGFEPLDLHFVRDKEKREVDFLITRNQKPWLLIETKLNSTEPDRALNHFAGLLGVKHKILVVAHLEEGGRAGDISVLDAPSFLSHLPV